jgi:hypothetical protein
MKKPNKAFRLEKIPVETLINLLMQLYDGGIDFVDLSADRSDPNQDKLLIFTKESYINDKHYDPSKLVDFEMDEEDDEPQKLLPPKIETRRLSDDDIDKLL